ncbi:MAG: hypothetical protein OIF54_01290 [Cohaesibacter sp.]|nr:hypothetical protein [Cohaesibacter sp.]
MADYYAILKRAVSSLPDSTREQRQAVYDKARNALFKQLQSMDPPLPPSEISKQRVALEEAVRSVERDLIVQNSETEAVTQSLSGEEGARAPSVCTKDEPPTSKEALKGKAPEVSVSTSPASSQVSVSHKSEAPMLGQVGSADRLESEDKVVRRAGQDVLKNAVRDAEKLGAATNAAVRSAQETADMVGDQSKGEASRIEPKLGDAVVSSAKTYKASASGMKVGKEDAAHVSVEEGGNSSKFGLFVSVAIAALVLGGGAYLLYQNKSDFLGQGGDSIELTQSSSSGEVASGSDSATPSDGQEQEMVAKNVRTVTVTPQEQQSEEETLSDLIESVEPNAATAGQGAQDGSGANQTVSGSSSAIEQEQQVSAVADAAIEAIFYEENGTSGRDGQASPGQTRWALDGEGEESVVKVFVEVPKRNISFQLSFSKNKDETLPASHLIEIEAVNFGPTLDLQISEIPGLIMKPTEDSRGQGLFGEPVRIADDLHWIALNAGEKALRYNLELLALRQWIDIPILFKSGRRGILTIQKGESGKVVMEDALRQWGK